MNKDLMFSSRNLSWATPIELMEKLHNEFNFDIDLCSSHEQDNVIPNYFTEEEDGLLQDWSKFKIAYMNPPYGREWPKWVEKAYHSSSKGVSIIALLPSRTDTEAFHEYIYQKEGVYHEFIKGRIKFGTDKYWEWLWNQPTLRDKNGSFKKNPLYKKYGRKDPAPFGSMMVAFDRSNNLKNISFKKFF